MNYVTLKSKRPNPSLHNSLTIYLSKILNSPFSPHLYPGRRRFLRHFLQMWVRTHSHRRFLRLPRRPLPVPPHICTLKLITPHASPSSLSALLVLPVQIWSSAAAHDFMERWWPNDRSGAAVVASDADATQIWNGGSVRTQKIGRPSGGS
uniref:Uncharacterized protein n=1 Tax=Kalanchoe fedtschenkoi TaxID=63787 RepID=A0A7N0T497_KALFE